MACESDDDMFADLEKTLCEGLTTLRFNQSIDYSDDIDVTCLEKVNDLSKINGPAVRTYNLYKAMRAFQNKQYLDSIYFETFAMSLFMRIKFHANKIMETETHMPTEDNLIDFLEQKRGHDEQPEIIDYVDRFLNDKILHATKQLKTIEFENGTELMGLCNQLPREWTVIQLCKAVNPDIFRQSRDEILRHPCGIFITLFCYPMSDRFDNQPIKIDLNQSDLRELYESAHHLTTLLNDPSGPSTKMTDKEFDETIVSKLKKLLGPWIVCLSGKSKCSSDDREIMEKVDHFLLTSPHKFSKRQKTLTCLIGRRVHMLTKENIRDGALYISKTKDEFLDLMDFFDDLKLSCKNIQQNTYPVILVVDDHIDYMFWEMCNLEQEFTRVDSMVTLLKLYFHHQNNMSEGYFNVKGKNAGAVLNPDRTLKHYESLIQPFMKALPSVNCKFLIEKEPEFTDLKSMLNNSDVYVYCGHGSGLQFISSYETCQLSTNAVVFLMGCSSVAFNADFGYCLATAAHHYYHIAKSPAVVGHLTLTYTTYGATLLNIMMGKCFSHLTKFDDVIWGESSGGKHFQKNLGESFLGDKVFKYSPYLSNIISQVRKKCNIPICFRAILCHRGLPVRMT